MDSLEIKETEFTPRIMFNVEEHILEFDGVASGKCCLVL